MVLIVKILRWLGVIRHENCFLCREKIDLKKDTYSILNYSYLHGEDSLFLCDPCSQEFQDVSFDLHEKNIDE